MYRRTASSYQTTQIPQRLVDEVETENQRYASVCEAKAKFDALQREKKREMKGKDSASGLQKSHKGLTPTGFDVLKVKLRATAATATRKAAAPESTGVKKQQSLIDRARVLSGDAVPSAHTIRLVASVEMGVPPSRVQVLVEKIDKDSSGVETKTRISEWVSAGPFLSSLSTHDNAPKSVFPDIKAIIVPKEQRIIDIFVNIRGKSGSVVHLCVGSVKVRNGATVATLREKTSRILASSGRVWRHFRLREKRKAEFLGAVICTDQKRSQTHFPNFQSQK